MEREFKILLGAVIVFGLIVAGALSQMSTFGSRGRFGPVARPIGAHDTSAQLAELIDSSETPIAATDSVPIETRLARLRAPITQDELTGVQSDTALDIIQELRPAWLSDSMDARAQIGNQIVGHPNALNNVPSNSVFAIRLVFSPDEPHWTIRVDLH